LPRIPDFNKTYTASLAFIKTDNRITWHSYEAKGQPGDTITIIDGKADVELSVLGINVKHFMLELNSRIDYGRGKVLSETYGSDRNNKHFHKKTFMDYDPPDTIDKHVMIAGYTDAIGNIRTLPLTRYVSDFQTAYFQIIDQLGNDIRALSKFDSIHIPVAVRYKDATHDVIVDIYLDENNEIIMAADMTIPSKSHPKKRYRILESINYIKLWLDNNTLIPKNVEVEMDLKYFPLLHPQAKLISEDK
jgi:hypothetical protein